MEFQRHKISNQPKQTPTKKLHPFLKVLLIILIFIGLSLALFAGVFLFFSKVIGIKETIFFFGSELQQDADKRTNFLLLGSGVEGLNDAADLTDTIMVASLNNQTSEVSLFSIPRDLYVTTKELGAMRINQIYMSGIKEYGPIEGKMPIMREVEKITGLEIHYWAKINFNGLKQIVDALGGIEIDVKESIYDPSYPKDGTFSYEPFRISAGFQTLDGKTALKYARSRKTTSDFDRSRRQSEIIFGIKEKAKKLNILTNPGKITELYSSINQNFETNLSLTEIISLAEIGQDINRDAIVSRSIHDDPATCGGFLYTPQRSLFGGAFVLIPIGANRENPYEYIKQFVQLTLNRDESFNQTIQILNGTKTEGLAGEVRSRLQRYCFNVVRYGNARNQKLEKTFIYQKPTPLNLDNQNSEPETQTTLETMNPTKITRNLQELIGGEISSNIPSEYLDEAYRSEAQIIIELGNDYLTHENRNQFMKFTLPINTYEAPQIPEPTTETTQEEQGTTETLSEVNKETSEAALDQPIQEGVFDL
jgi:LCP family protein required for cell wall assembly